MINQVQIRLPYPVRVGFFSINRKINVHFSFDNLALFLFHQDEKINDSDGLKAWQEKHGKFDLFVYGAFYAAKSYAMHNRKEFTIDFKKFAVGLAQLDKSELERLSECWQRSQSYGAATIPGKKKVTAMAK